MKAAIFVEILISAQLASEENSGEAQEVARF